MKRKTILLLLVITLFTSISILPVYADQPIVYSAYGTIDEYYDAASAEVVSGYWSLKATENRVWFEAIYWEKNLDSVAENAPVGSVDTFTLKLEYNWRAVYEIDGDNLFIVGVMKFKKTGVNLDGKAIHRTGMNGEGILVSPDGIIISHTGTLSTWDLLGSTTEVITP